MGFFGGGGSAAGVGGSTGATDNAILRADGTGGASLQNSSLTIEDSTQNFSITGVASTDVITAVGHNFTTNQYVRFLSLTGGAGLSTATNYFVRDISGDTFKVSVSSGGGVTNFTTDITAGTIIAGGNQIVQIKNTSSDTNSFIVLTPKGTGGIIAQAPDGTTAGGLARGNNAVDFQTSRGAITNVASGANSVIVGGANNSASGTNGCAVVAGTNNVASANGSFIGGGNNQIASGAGSVIAGGGDANLSGGANGTNTASATLSAILGGARGVADRYGMQAHANNYFAANGDAQRARFVLRCKTTTNSAVEMALDGSTTYLTIPSGKVIFCNIKVVGVKSDGSVVATYERQYAAKNVGGTSSEVFAAITIGADNASSTSLAVATVDAGDYISIKPTGIASETWRWVASVDAVEVAYGT
jgi:hypothetical protein